MHACVVSPPPKCRSAKARPHSTTSRPSTAVCASASPPRTPCRAARCAPSLTRGSTRSTTTCSLPSQWTLTIPKPCSPPPPRSPSAGSAPSLPKHPRSPRCCAGTAALADGDAAAAEGLLAWLGGQPHVAAAVKRQAGIRGDLDHDGALAFLAGLLTILRGAGYSGLVLVLDEIETLQRVRSDTRDRALNALRQLIDEIDQGRFPGLYLVITGTPAFFDGPQGASRLPPLAQRLHTDFTTDVRFDNPRDPAATAGFRHRRAVRGGPQGAGPLRRRQRARAAAARHLRRRVHRDAGPSRHRQPGWPRRHCPTAVPQEARCRRARPGRPVCGLRSAPGLHAHPVRRRTHRGRAQRPCGRHRGRHRSGASE